MPDLVQKQLVAKIDRRTTVVCLHAAGQIQPVDRPFQTINGDYDRPPFHVHCRSLVTVWMPGFVNRYRAEANAELRLRPLSQRRLADGRIPSRIPKPPDPFGAVTRAPAAPRLPGGAFAQADDDLVRAVARGDHDLRSLSGQVDLKDLIDRVPERFAVSGNGGGLSETYWVTDLRTGRRYSLKMGSRNSGSIVEVVSTELQDALGLRLSRSWFADGVGGNRWTITEHIEDVRAGAKVVGSGRTPAQMAKAVRTLNDPGDVVDTVLNDFLLDQTDRKSGNWLRLKVGSKEEWVPIDHDGTFLGHAGLGKQDLTLGTRSAIDLIETYVHRTGTPPKGFVDAARQVNADLVAQRYDDIVARAQTVDIDDLLAPYRGVTGELDDRLDEIASIWRARLDGLIRHRQANLRYLSP